MVIQQPRLLKVLLVGESCIDEYEVGEVTRISPEAPVPILLNTSINIKKGMAENVKSNLLALGCETTFFTNKRDKIIKRRFIDKKSNQQLLRQDVEQRIKPLMISDFNHVAEDSVDVVVISDYCKGLITPKLAAQLCTKYKYKVYVDSKKEDLSCFPYSVIKINELENEYSRNLPDTSTKVVTLGSEGAICEGERYTSKKVKVHDVTGAGDVFLAALATIASTKGLQSALQIAVRLASKSVEHFGTYTITNEDLKEAGYFND